MIYRLPILILILFSFSACSAFRHNATVFPYEYRPELIENPIRTVMISPINYDKPTRYYLTKHEESIDEDVKNYLSKNGISTISNKSFKSLWEKAPLEYGSTFDPSTGESTPAFKPALQHTMQTLFEENPGLDAIIFTDILTKEMTYDKNPKRLFEWDGIDRKVRVEGKGYRTEDFKGVQILDAISIGIYVVNRKLQLIHHSVGGIQIAQALILSNKSVEFGRRKDLLENEDEVEEGLALAFHPFLTMKHYPGN